MPRRMWIDTTVSLTPALGAAGSMSLITGISSTQTRGDQMTLLRTIIGLDLAHNVHDAGEGSVLTSIGIGITSQEAFSASIFPDPQTATDFPTRGWVWRAQYRTWSFAADQPAVFTRRVDLDLRSMRKLENGEAYLTVFSTLFDGAASVVSTTGLIRQLWLVS